MGHLKKTKTKQLLIFLRYGNMARHAKVELA